MMRENWSCSIYGQKFYPENVEEFFMGTDIIIKKTPGDIATRGRYKGKALPYGSVHLTASLDRVLSFLESVVKKENLFIEDMDVTLVVAYENQCNMEMDPACLLRIGKLGIPLLITCYEDPDSFELDDTEE